MGTMSIKSSLFLFGVATLVGGIFIVKEECPPNEEYLLCGSACPSNCTDPQPVTCSDDCVEGCFCKSGFMRDENATCVSADKCVGNAKPICGDNEEFVSCGTACPLTCSQPSEPPVCGLACSMGCLCKSGYVRDEASKKCVTLENCPAEQCFSTNEVFDICNANCEPSCDDPTPICVTSCTSGCVCAPGLFRNQTGDCVSVDKCPQGNSTAPGVLTKYMDVIKNILNLSSA